MTDRVSSIIHEAVEGYTEIVSRFIDTPDNKRTRRTIAEYARHIETKIESYRLNHSEAAQVRRCIAQILNSSELPISINYDLQDT